MTARPHVAVDPYPTLFDLAPAALPREDRRARPSSTRRERVPHTSIGAVIREMEERARALEVAGDFRAVFARSYLTTTRHIEAALRRGAFLDAAWVERIDCVFAQRYFDAFDDWEAGRPCPGPWRLAFEHARARNTFVLQDLLLGMNAHIAWDLPLSLEATIPGHASEELLARRRRDHEVLNLVLGEAIDDVQRDAGWQYDPALAVADVVCGRLDEAVSAWMIKSWRTEVWEDFSALQAARGGQARGGAARDAVESRIEAEATETARRVLLPQRALGPVLAPLGLYRDAVRAARRSAWGRELAEALEISQELPRLAKGGVGALGFEPR